MKKRRYVKIICGSLLVFPLLVIAAPTSAKCIGTDQANIRSGPSLSSDIIFSVPLGYPIEIEKEKGGWTLVYDWQSNRGWVFKPLILDTKTAVILVNKANIRNSANQGAAVVGAAEKGEIYKVLSQEGNWSKLGYFEGDSFLGWVRNDFVFVK